MVQGCLGIGFALVAGPPLIAVDADFVPGPLLLAGQFVGIRHVVVERDHIDRKAFSSCLIGLPGGLAGGLAVLSVSSARTSAMMIGTFTAIAAIALLAGASIRRTRSSDAMAGAAVAFSSVTAGLPGPPLIVAFSDMAPATMRATSSLFILVVGATGLTALILAGEFGVEESALTAWMVPGIGAGMLLARVVRPYLDHSFFRPVVLIVALLGALSLIARHV